MPSTRRPQASATGQAQGRSEPEASLSPKITRSARVFASQDAVEQESTARVAKRRKTACSLPLEATIDRGVDQSISDDARESSDSVQHGAARRDVNNNGRYDEAKMLREEEYKGPVSSSGPADPNKTLAGPERTLAAPSTTSLSMATSSEDDIATLDQLTDQILNIIIRTTPTELGSAIKDPASNTGKEYLQLQARFAAAKQRYGRTKAFISPSDLSGSNPVAVGLEVLDSYFLFTFLPRGGILSKLAASLWIELKTQALIAAVVTEDIRPPTIVLSVLLDENVRQQLFDIRPGADELAPSEEDFISGLRSRQSLLEVEMAKNNPQALAQSYRWTDLENAVTYIKILKLDDDKLTGSERLLLKPRSEMVQGGTEKSLSQRLARNGDTITRPVRPNGYVYTPEESFKHRLTRRALLAMQAVGLPFFTHEDVPWPLISNSTHLQEEQPAVKEDTSRSPEKTPMDLRLVHEGSKSFRDRSATSCDRVRGPDWARILSDDQLNQRTQMELRDKAKSLKLFFLKAGIEVPYFLKEATKSGSTIAPLKRGEGGISSINAPAKAEGSI